MAIETTKAIAADDYQRIALILVEALFYGEKKAAKRWNITTRTIRNYRYVLDENKELSDIFHDKRKDFEGDWAKNIPGAIISGIEFIAEATREADYKDPETIMAISNAIKVLTEIGLTKEIIDARLAGYYREDRTENRQVDSGIASSGSTREVES